MTDFWMPTAESCPCTQSSANGTAQHQMMHTGCYLCALGKDFSLCVFYSQPAGDDKKHYISFHSLKVRNFELFQRVFIALKYHQLFCWRQTENSSWYSWKHLRQRAQEEIRIIHQNIRKHLSYSENDRTLPRKVVQAPSLEMYILKTWLDTDLSNLL